MTAVAASVEGTGHAMGTIPALVDRYLAERDSAAPRPVPAGQPQPQETPA